MSEDGLSQAHSPVRNSSDIVAGTGVAATAQAVLGNPSTHVEDPLRVTSVRTENGRGSLGIVSERAKSLTNMRDFVLCNRAVCWQHRW